MTIYTQILPTYLYIKQHSVTGLKYFGKTTRSNPYKYLGSGTYWKKHIKKHGKEHVITLWVSDLYTNTSIIEHAIHFSTENNIVESKDWANLVSENGLDGGSKTYNKVWITDGKSDRYILNTEEIPLDWRLGRSNCKFKDRSFQTELSNRPRIKKSIKEKKDIAKRGIETRKRNGSQYRAFGDLNPSKRPEVREKISKAAKNRPKIICPHCNKIGVQSPGMYKSHFNNCKNENKN